MEDEHNLIHNRSAIGRPLSFGGGPKNGGIIKPLQSKRLQGVMRVVVATGLEPVTPTM